ncbi:Uncharacterised protein [uncultured archaeon]|nr:Uncharacterised protein [uncultured archaeon]
MPPEQTNQHEQTASLQTSQTAPAEPTRGTEFVGQGFTFEDNILKIRLKPTFKSKTIKGEEKTIGFSGSIAYLVELIIQFSKYITKGRGLSKNGVNALLLFLLTAGLLYTNTEMPKTLMDGLKLYWVSLIFLCYSLVDLANNREEINRFFRRLGRRIEYTYEKIMDGSINYEDLEYELSDLSFSYNQIKDIIKKLIDSGQFTPNIQSSLLLNNSIYRIDIMQLIQDSFIKPVIINPVQEQEQFEQGKKAIIETLPINIKWTSSAVCIFLSKRRKNLSKEYLDELIDKYGEYPSVLIAIGHFCRYKRGEDTYFFRIGTEFKYTKLRTKFSMALLLSTTAIFLVFAFSMINLPVNVKQSYSFYSSVIIALVLLSALVFIYVANNDLLWSLKSHLKKYNVIKDDFLASEIISDLLDSFQ